MTAGEKSARALFDTAMKLNNIQLFDKMGEGKKGQLFDYDALSKMTREDLPKALNVLSEMYMKGQLNTQTMQKMFTARHFMEISNLLIDINGNTDAFVERLAKGVDYSNDFYKKMFDINEQIKLAKNNMLASTGGAGQSLTKMLTGLLMSFNNGMSKSVEETKDNYDSLGGTISALGVVFGTTTLAGSALIKVITPLLVTTGGWGIAIGALAAGVAYLGKNIYDTDKKITDFNMNTSKNLLLDKQINNEMSNTINLREHLNRLVDESIKSQREKNSLIDEEFTLMGMLLDKNKDLKTILEATDKVSTIKESDKIVETKEDRERLKALEESLIKSKESFDGIFETINRNIDEYRDRTINALKDINTGKLSLSNLLENSGNSSRRLTLVEPVKLLIADLKEGKYNIEEFNKEIEKLGISKRDLDIITQGSLDSEYNGMSEILEKKQEILKVEKESNEALKEKLKLINERITANQNAYNLVSGRINQLKLKDFETTGNFEGQSGALGVLALVNKNQTDAFNTQIKMYGDALKELNKEKDKLENRKSKGIASKEDLEDLVEVNNQIEKTNSQLNIQKKLNESSKTIQESYVNSAFKGIETTKKTIPVMIEIFKVKQMISQLRILNPDEKNMILLYQKYLSELEKDLINSQKKIDSKKRETTYQLKYTNALKESLSLELESLKIGKTKAEQEYLTYEYKLKQLEVDKQIAEEALKVTSIDLKNSKAGSFENYKQMALKAGSARELQEVLNKIFMNDDRVRKGNAGAEEKAFVDTLKSAIQAKVKHEGILQNIEIIPRETINNFKNKTLPDLNKSIVGMLRDSFDLTGISLINSDSLNLENLKTELSNLIQQVGLNGLEDASLDIVNRMILAQRERVNEALKQSEKDPSQNNSDILKKEETQLNNLLEIQAKKLKISKEELDIELKKLSVYGNMGNMLSSLGKGTNIKGLESIGDIFKGMSNFGKTSAENKFDLGELFNFDSKNFADTFGKAMTTAISGIDFGSTIGSFIGSITGGGASSQAGGAIGGMISGLGGAEALGSILGISAGPAGMAISAGMSLIGGLFKDDGKDQEEAQRKTAEAKKIYDKNTEALNKLAQNMANLSGGVDGLNNSLISAFSKLPTFGNLTNITGAMKDLYNTMEKTRKFNNVAYQVTKTKKGKSGFMGIGAKAGATWTETIELSVQDMLNKYGFKGAIEDMTTNQMRDFSTWLKDYDMGDSDNFSILASAIEDYAEALDKFDKNIENFFYDTTMESFSGISSLQQEELRQQIEDFYKNMGFQIDEEMSKVIDDLADKMSIMVTIMQDVRSSFISSWRESGKDAGSAFLSSMNPYIDAMLENISQVFYDVYFSDVTDALNKEFKSLSEKLVELKKQGSKLDWNSVASSLGSSFDKVISSIQSAKLETESFNTVILELQKQAKEAGLSLSEILELGLVSGTQKDVLKSFKDSLLSNESEGALTSIGQMVGDKIGDALANKMLDNMLSDKILEFSANIDKIASGNLSFDSLAGVANESLSVGLMLSEQQKRLKAIKDMFDFNKDIVYDSQESNISYETGTSQSIVNNYYLTATVEAGNIIEADSIERLTDALADSLLEKFRVDKGIDLFSKNY